MKHIASYFASVDETGSPLCGWIESKGNRCFDNAAYLDKRVKAFFCKKHAEITRCQVKHHQLVELHIDDDNQILKQRIKRLEEAGDEMSHTCITIDADRWRKAKEAKP
jgi:hypothetical protein